MRTAIFHAKSETKRKSDLLGCEMIKCGKKVQISYVFAGKPLLLGTFANTLKNI